MDRIWTFVGLSKDECFKEYEKLCSLQNCTEDLLHKAEQENLKLKEELDNYKKTITEQKSTITKIIAPVLETFKETFVKEFKSMICEEIERNEDEKHEAEIQRGLEE